MPNTARLAPTPFLPLSRVPRYRVSAGNEQGGGRLNEVRGIALVVLLCLTLYAPGLASIPPVDRDEARFAQATRQMLETGDFIQIRFQHEARNKKPIGIHWLQAASVALFSAPDSTAIWPYRVPSALAATIAVLLTSVLGATLLSSRGAGWWPLLAAALVGMLAAGFALPAAGVVVPALDLLWLSRAAATVVARHQPRRDEAVLSVGYSEPSLVFLLGTATRLVTAAPADQQLAGAGMALVSDRDDAAFRRSLGSRGLHPLAIDRVSGLDYSAGGGRVTLTLYGLERR